MRHLVIGVTMLLALTSSAGAQAPAASFEFRGAHMADSISSRPKGWGWSCVREKADSLEVCIKFSERIADQQVSLSYAYFAGRLTVISWDYKPESFDALRVAFEAKYGPPLSVDHPDWQSQGGVTVANTVIKWSLPDAQIEMAKYGRRLDQGEATATHPGLAERLGALKKARAEAAAKKDM